MQKEQVTLNNIKKDLLQYIFYEVLGALIGIPILWGGLVLIVALINAAIENSLPVIELITVFFSLWWIFNIVKICIAYFKVVKSKFTIRTDTLAEKADYEYRRIPWTPKREYIPRRLIFNDGCFNICSWQHYKWSTKNSMDEKDLYNTSCIKDTFTVVELDHKIIAVYNHRFFDVSYPESQS